MRRNIKLTCIFICPKVSYSYECVSFLQFSGKVSQKNNFMIKATSVKKGIRKAIKTPIFKRRQSIFQKLHWIFLKVNILVPISKYRKTNILAMYLQGTTLHFAFLANFKIPSIVLQYRSAWLRVFLAFNERPLLR